MGKRGAVVIDRERCKGCELCIVSCGAGALRLSAGVVNGRGYGYVEVCPEKECIGCANCGEVCPEGALTVYRGGRG
ncbi:MAG: 4Fe-4S binding protein [Tannerellaceae bacterium]|jgi:2-oxoglutarate ferredoxin oxidoreductase subunit delta|nr:4Fe-4S binding protein [Tannerellaceae bacterium]